VTVRRWAALATILAPAAALWSAGSLGAHSPTILGCLLAASGLGGVTGLVWGGRFGPGGRPAGAIVLAAASAFPLVLFHVPEGPVPIEQRATALSRRVERLRLVDFNVWHDHPRWRDAERRADVLAAALAELEPDVVVLQEAWRTQRGDLAERLAVRLGLDLAYAGANGSRRLIGFEEGSAVLSRLPILLAERWVLAPHAPPWTRRIALRVRLDAGGGTRLDVVGVHLTDCGEPAVSRQAAELAARLADTTLVAGDLNATSGSAALMPFARRGFADLLPGGIDHVLLASPSAWRAAGAAWTLRPGDLAATAGAPELSDHPGIVVDLERRDAAPAPAPPQPSDTLRQSLNRAGRGRPRPVPRPTGARTRR
jgi:endonuclease/exonuclease/phosphatase family metal-dependent hydrolase